jgi:hypothetical protein
VSYLAHSADVKNPRFNGHVWKSGTDGTINATLDLQTGASRIWLCFDNPADARSLAAACINAAEAMERLKAETAPDPAGVQAAEEGAT